MRMNELEKTSYTGAALALLCALVVCSALVVLACLWNGVGRVPREPRMTQSMPEAMAPDVVGVRA